MCDEKVEIAQMDINNLAFDPCLVCGSKTKGLRYQVSSCRACAAFFRRATKTKQIFQCQRGTKNCDLTNKMKGRPLCRYCRLKKCKEIGMKLEHDEETKLENPPPSIAVSTASSSIPIFSPSTIASPTTSHLGMPKIEGRKITYDAAPLVQAIKNIFSQETKSNQYLASGVRFFEPMMERSLKFVIIPAKAMRLTQFEIVYLAGIVLWTVSGKAFYAYKQVHEFLGIWTGQSCPKTLSDAVDV
uniref:Nuclear receptor domain-containing protein n=1 Tax=Acrobeloides nanus TaxID=290746 RepID=A0A914D0V7_9BILA